MKTTLAIIKECYYPAFNGMTAKVVAVATGKAEIEIAQVRFWVAIEQLIFLN